MSHSRSVKHTIGNTDVVTRLCCCSRAVYTWRGQEKGAVVMIGSGEAGYGESR